MELLGFFVMVNIFDDGKAEPPAVMPVEKSADQSRRAENNDSRRAAAVALKKYGIDETALPKIVAAGYGKWAEQIVEMAFKNGVKVREDKDLAQMLAAIEIDSDIPTEALVAIAEILAYVYKANGTYQAGIEQEEKPIP
jgi:flagellar biosynthesis protein